jgi:hypothetical protein
LWHLLPRISCRKPVHARLFSCGLLLLAVSSISTRNEASAPRGLQPWLLHLRCGGEVTLSPQSGRHRDAASVNTIATAHSTGSHVVTSNARNVTLLKNGVFWDVTPCGFCKKRRFGGTCRLHHQGDNDQRASSCDDQLTVQSTSVASYCLRFS